MEFPWGEALSLAGVQATGLLLIQLERLVLPHVLPLSDLATYGVLGGDRGSLFRVLQMGVGLHPVPPAARRHRRPQRRRLVAQRPGWSARRAAGSAVIWLVTPLVERWFLAGKYHLSAALVLAALVSGVAKVVNAFTKRTASALATRGSSPSSTVLGWVSVVIALAAASSARAGAWPA